MSTLNLRTVISRLQSDKAKDRQQGISTLREVFSRNASVESFDEKGDGRTWLVVFQALFTAVVSERTVVTRKDTAAATAEQRLKDAAFTVRWLVEKSVAHWGTRVLTALVSHLLQVIAYKGRLFSPVALDYAKALRAICSYPPHLDHIMAEESQWTQILSLSFAVVLDDDLNVLMDDDPEISASEEEATSELSSVEEMSGRKRKKRISYERKMSRHTPPRTASPEQIEFVALIAVLLSSPKVKLVSAEHPRRSGIILEKLHRFFKLYSLETSAHLDALNAVQSTLSLLALNSRYEVIEFGTKMWEPLLSLWPTKSKKVKEGVLAILKLLLPYIVHADAEFNRVDGICKLVSFLQADHESRWGFDELSLDALRLEATNDRIERPFISQTFRLGVGFSAGHAVAWTVLELLTDSMKELYLLWESTHSVTAGPYRADGKRIKLENPMKPVFQSLQSPECRGKTFILQSLLFIIDRHWSVLHAEMRSEVFEALKSLLTTDDSLLQSWLFCCFAAIAHTGLSPNADFQWCAIWSHAMRRTNSPTPVVSRTACHAAHALLACGVLPASRVLPEIETLAQDIDIQGPPAPFDSVCMFLSRCIKVAGQDARLYRMRLDDKVLSWFIENWNVHGGDSKALTISLSAVSRLGQNTIKDMLVLLESACNLSVPGLISCSLLASPHPFVALLQAEIDSVNIRTFLLDASFPNVESVLVPAGSQSVAEPPIKLSIDQVQPDARVRRVSAFLVKSLELMLPFWENLLSGQPRPSVESIRRALDFAILVICFESSLEENGIVNNRRAITSASKVLTLLVPFVTNLGWSTEELSTLVSCFIPLTTAHHCGESLSSKWDAFICPGKSAGVTGVNLVGRPSNGKHLDRRLHSSTWQSQEVHDVLVLILHNLKQLLRSSLVGKGQLRKEHASPAVDDKDDFEPIRTATSPSVAVGSPAEDQTSMTIMVKLCVDVISTIPIPRSPECETMKDKALVDIVCSCDDDALLIILEPFLRQAQHESIHLTMLDIDRLLTRIENPLKSYNYSKSEEMRVLAIRLLEATCHIWTRRQASSSSATAEAAGKIRDIIDWFATTILKDRQLLSWNTRDVLARFYNRYLSLDPLEKFLAPLDEKELSFEVDDTPSVLLPSFSQDEDIRVRFTAALSCARLFSSEYLSGKDPLIVYEDVQSRLCVVLSNYEHMLTRFLCLGNIMIASSSLRRGAYWHILETCLYGQSSYVQHVETVLTISARRLGLARYTDLFEAYASHLAFTIRQSQKDFFSLPPKLLGYRDLRECAEATFETFSPANLLGSPQDVQDLSRGQGAFARHCLMLDRKPTEGLLRCFADIAGYSILLCLDENSPTSVTLAGTDDAGDIGMDSLNFMQKIIASAGCSEPLPELIQQSIDRIVCAILRTASDINYHKEGPIVTALQGLDKSERAVRAFRALMKYRVQGEFEMHAPNVPAFSTSTVLRALNWLSRKVKCLNSPATTYHVLHYFFASTARCPLINEQLRNLSCLSIWISYAYSHFKNVTLLRVLMIGAVSLLDQPDLSAIAQGMLEWAFIHLRELQCDSPHISDLLIRISTSAKALMQFENQTIQNMGQQMRKWLEGQIVVLGGIKALRKRIAVALAAWPDQTDNALQNIIELAPNDLSRILDDPYLSTHRFKVAKRLSAIACDSVQERGRFAKHDFWMLKDSIPEYLPVEEIDAFISLILTNCGEIRSRALDPSYGRSVSNRLLRLTMERDDKGQRNHGASAKKAIVSALLEMSTFSVPAAHNAYLTLRRLSSIESLDAFEFGSWPSEHRDDISFLNFCFLKGNSVQKRGIAELLQPNFLDMASDFTTWISDMTLFLTEVLAAIDPFYSPLSGVLKTNATFAEDVFPVLVHSILNAEHSASEARLVLSEYFSKLLGQIGLHDRCHKAIVNLVLHLRSLEPKNSSNVLAYNQWLDLDYELLSRSAIKCGAYTTALLFLELSQEFRDTAVIDPSSYEQILFDIYGRIDEPDGFYGIQTRDQQTFLLRRFHHEQQWDKAFRFHGAQFEAGDKESDRSKAVFESLHNFGFNKLAMSTLDSLDDYSALSNSEMKYQLGWRTETWDLPEPDVHKYPNSSLYTALRAIHRERDPSVVQHVVTNAMSIELHRLRDLGDENLIGIREATRNLMCISQTRRWISEFAQVLKEDIPKMDEVPWSEYNWIPSDFDFADLENIIATRISLLRSFRRKEQREQMGDMDSDITRALMQTESNCLVRLSKAARVANQPQIALNSILCALQLKHVSPFEVNQEFADVLWIQSEQKSAVECLKKELRNHIDRRSDDQGESKKLREALLLAKLGEWTNEACLEKPGFIQSNYFSPAINLLKTSGQHNKADLIKTRAAVFYKCALFSESQYQVIVSSPEIIRLKLYKERKEQELRDREAILKTSSAANKQELTQHQKRARALLEQDTAQFIEVTNARGKYLCQAIEMLSLCLEVSNIYDGDATIRFCSLWFANFTTNDLFPIISRAVAMVPSRKFVFLAHQLSARLSGSEDSKTNNQDVLQLLLLRMCGEHPFHSVYQVYSLQSQALSTKSSSSTSRRSSDMESDSSNWDRATAASGIFDRLYASERAAKIRDIRLLCDAYLEWAKFPIKKDEKVIAEKKKRKEPLPIPKDLAIRNLSRIHVPVATVDTPLDPTMQYQDCVWIYGYAPNYDTAGGINLPKISYCIGSDGIKYKQLFKGEGNDDLRQDAVMEQVFELCNQVLSRDRDTRKRDLRIRSYKVIPLAPQAGLLEFVGNTTPMHNWLVGAHARYYSEDLQFRECANQMASLRKSISSERLKSALVDLFKKIRKRFHPVMRHFFAERHRVPQNWFEMRLNYSRSVAVTSIVGHILGLGDRHISNILLDTATGEVVHIDLGIAFEQGKLLNVPERVPFRLTADIVDGFGMSGTEGVFRRCAEETLRVLRDGSDVIKTVLEVFKYDPLHSWTASAVKIQKVQGSVEPLAPSPRQRTNSNSIGKQQQRLDRLPNDIGIDMSSGMEVEAADRALSGVARKLDKKLSVEFTVNDLIAEATDIENLALMFAGWSPFC